MSRIDEALKRASRDNGNAPTTPAQAVFEPAWEISEKPVPQSAPAPALNGAKRALTLPAGGESPGLVAFSSAWREKLAAEPHGNPHLIEQFRRLAGTLHQAQRATGLRSVMITSATPGDGKTLTAVNLALVLADSYRCRVLLADADLRRPSIPNVVDFGDGVGLSEALRSQSEQKLALMNVTPRLTLLPAGQPIANSLEALTSPRMRQILEEGTTRFDWVILDAPPVGSTADARLLSEMVGGTLFVVHAGKTQFTDVQKAIDSLGRERIMGIVLNGVDEPSPPGYYYGPSNHKG